MQRQQENWGKPSGGTDFLVDAGSSHGWQGEKAARMG